MNYLPESELVINNRGAIYHFDVRPEELAQTVITVGDPERVFQVSNHFDRIEVQRQHREFVTHTGVLGNKRISVVSTGIGTDNIDIVMNELDALVNIDFENRIVKPSHTSLTIIRIGTSGSLQAGIPVDSFVASTHVIGIDNLMNYYRHENNNEEKLILQNFITHTQLNSNFSHPYISSAGSSVLKHFVDEFFHGITVTCPGFYGPQGRVLRMGLTNPDLINSFTNFSYGSHQLVNMEMETSAIYGLGKLLGHKCLSLSAIVNNRTTKQFTKDVRASVEKLIQHTLEIITSI